MSPQKIALPLLLLLAVFGGILLILENEAAPQLLPQPQNTEAEAPKTKEHIQAQPSTKGLEIRSTGGRTVKVIDPDGNPVAGASVFFRFAPAIQMTSQLARMKKETAQFKAMDFRSWMGGQDPLQTDANGISILPST
jgi:hypothetical protein